MSAASAGATIAVDWEQQTSVDRQRDDRLERR
jgi:hypothetical protein